jgi:uncharacterized membrane protein
MPLWLNVLDGLLWLIVVAGLLRLAWQHRGEFHFSEAGAPADPRFYVGPFYNNPDDPRLLVPKPFGPIELGWTVNVAHPHAGRAIGMLLGIVLASVLLGTFLRR